MVFCHGERTVKHHLKTCLSFCIIRYRRGPCFLFSHSLRIPLDCGPVVFNNFFAYLVCACIHGVCAYVVVNMCVCMQAGGQPQVWFLICCPFFFLELTK